MKHFVGLDWASLTHAVCVVNEAGSVVKQLEVTHSREGLTKLLAQLARLAPPAELPVAMERPTGLLVDMLVAAGHPVVPIHPNVVKACRPRYRATGAKSDAADAYILADLLRTDGHRFRPLQPNSDALRSLRAQVRARDDLVRHRIALANQLRATLERFWPGAAAIFAEVDTPIALDFLQRYPTPDSANCLGPKRLAGFLARHAYCGRRAPEELLERLRAAPTGLVEAAEQEAQGLIVLAFVAALRPVVHQIKLLTAAIEHDVAQLPSGQILMSFPRAGRLNAAQILSELGDDLSRFADEDHLAAEAGVVPVTYASGKHHHVASRFACNKHLRRAVTIWADNSRHASPWARSVYDRARARGCRHTHAVRILARAWIRVLWRCLLSQQPYDPTQHAAAARLAQAA